jgi:flagellar assembly protein FliH
MSKAMWQQSTMTAAVFPELVGGQECGLLTAPPTVEDQAQTILAQADRQAQALMGSARQKAASLVDAWHHEGVLQGRAEGLAETRHSLQELTRALSAGCERLATLENECRVRAEELIVDVGLAVAERILRAEVAQNRTVMLGVVKGAVAALPEPGPTTIRIHPDGADLVQAHLDEVAAQAPGISSIRILADPSVALGGCVVETPHSVVDAAFPAQLAEARHRLLEAPC